MSTPTAESSHRVRGLRNIDVDGPGQPALVFEHSDRRLRQRGDRVESEHAVHIAGVGIGGILGGRRVLQKPRDVTRRGCPLGPHVHRLVTAGVGDRSQPRPWLDLLG